MTYSKELYHHGVKGMRWGVRRYQNEDGSLTTAGKKRYDGSPLGKVATGLKKVGNAYKEHAKSIYNGMVERGHIDQDRSSMKRAYNEIGRHAEVSRDARAYAERYREKALLAERKGNLEKARKYTEKGNRLITDADSKLQTALHRNLYEINQVTQRRGREAVIDWMNEAALSASTYTRSDGTKAYMPGRIKANMQNVKDIDRLVAEENAKTRG